MKTVNIALLGLVFMAGGCDTRTNDEKVRDAAATGDWKTWESTPTEADKAYTRELEAKLRQQ